MSLKSNASTLESSQGFKKRLLRPVSTNKQTNPIGEIKNKSVVNLKDTLSLKSKYSQVQPSIQALSKDIQPGLISLKNCNQIKAQDILGPSRLQFQPLVALQPLRKLILRIKQNVGDKNIGNPSKQNAQKSGSIHTGASFYDVGNRNQTRSDQIISQLKISNIEDGLNFLYGQNLELNKIIEKCTYFLGGCLLNHCEQQKQLDNQDLLRLINGKQDSLQLLTKLISVVIQKFLLPKTKNQTHTQSTVEKSPQESPKVKFKTIFTVRKDPQQEEEVKKLNQQLDRIKEQKCELQQKLKNIGLTIKDKVPGTESLSIESTQKIHDKIRLIYDETLNKKQLQISKLNQQKSELQEKLTRKQTSQSFHQSDSKKVFQQNLTTSSGLSSQNSEFSEFVQQEIQKMRQGFIKKLEKIQNQFIQKQNKLKKDLFKIEKDCQNVQFEKRIILKKYDFLLLSDK